MCAMRAPTSISGLLEHVSIMNLPSVTRSLRLSSFFLPNPKVSGGEGDDEWGTASGVLIIHLVSLSRALRVRDGATSFIEKRQGTRQRGDGGRGRGRGITRRNPRY